MFPVLILYAPPALLEMLTSQVPPDVRKAFLSLISPTVVVAIVAVCGVYFTARAALADVTLKRRLETAKRFTELAAVANNLDGKQGLYSQIAALELLASFGRDEEHLREAARAVLEQVQKQGTAQPMGISKVAVAASKAIGRLPK
ncbi:hypothetical protein AB0F44_28325 [Nocardioides sp. NPDC023903]|uniref:hypothetical protein n=1 Tax=Nocardioides sp. NPDC023903 TaxID=3157195 RepID=UPI0034110CAC